MVYKKYYHLCIFLDLPNKKDRTCLCHFYQNTLQSMKIRAKSISEIIEFHYLENGSFYLFKPYGLRKFNNRLYGRIGYAEMNKIKMFQIDSFDDIVLAENLIKQLNIN